MAPGRVLAEDRGPIWRPALPSMVSLWGYDPLRYSPSIFFFNCDLSFDCEASSPKAFCMS